MPENATWITQIPDALEEIKTQDEKELWFAEDLMILLGVEKRQALKLVKAATCDQPEKVGKAIAAPRDELRLWLEREGGEALKKEQARRKRLAVNLMGSKPPILADPKPEVQRPILRNGLDALPPGVTLEPGRITIEDFRTGIEALEKMFYTCQAVQVSGMEAFENLVLVKRKRAG